MTLAIPTLGAAPAEICTSTLPRSMEQLARDMARAGLVDESDFRVGGGGVRRLIEKPFDRAWRERGTPESHVGIPLRFYVMDARDWADAPRGAKGAWLVLDSFRSPLRCYTERFTRALGEARPEIVEHVLAVLYAGLESCCYSLKPSDMVRLVRAYWWLGRDDESYARSCGYRVHGRRWFDNRVPRITQEPRYNPRAFHGLRGTYLSRIRSTTEAVDRWSRDPRILRPNAHRLTGQPPGLFAVFVRAKYGDPTFRLRDDHWARMKTSCRFHGAWPIPRDGRGLRALLDRIEATARLVHAIEELIDETTYWSRGSFH